MIYEEIFPKDSRIKPTVRYKFPLCSKCPIYNDSIGSTSNIIDSSWGWLGIDKQERSFKYVFVTNRGNNQEYNFLGQGEIPFVKILWELNISSFFIISASICRHHKGHNQYLMKAIECCEPNFNNIMNEIIDFNKMYDAPPPQIIVLGKDTFQGIFPSTKQSIKMRDIMHNVYSHPAYPGVEFKGLWSPLAAHKNPDILREISAEIQAYEDKGVPVPSNPNTNYLLVETLEQFDNVIDILKSSTEISFDIETSGLKYRPMRKITQKKSRGERISIESIEIDTIIGISFSNEEYTGCYIPLYIKFKHFTEDRIKYLDNFWSPNLAFNIPDEVTDDSYFFWFGDPGKDIVYNKLKDLLEDSNIKKIAHNGKFDVSFLKEWWNIDVQNFYYDTMLASYLVNENSLNSLEFAVDIRYRDLKGYKSRVYDRLRLSDQEEENYADIPLESIAIYGAKDADATFRLRKSFDLEMETEYETTREESKTSNLWLDSKSLLHNFYMPLSHRYAEAERHGILFDIEYANILTKQYSEEMEILQQRIDTILIDAGIEKLDEKSATRHINLSSPKQKKTLFFDILGWNVIKPTKSVKDKRKYRKGQKISAEDASTDQDSLKQLLEDFFRNESDKALEIELIELILDYLKRNKMINTYLQGRKLYDRLDTNNYLHFSMKLHGTVSGRLSSSPNVQNLPKRTSEIQLPTGRIKAAMNIRGIFTAPENYKIFSCDLSQAELRIMADYAEDEVMLYYIKEGIDIHWKATLDLFFHGKNLIYDSKDPKMRRYRKLIKLCNFGGLYGGGDEKKVSSVNEKLELGEGKITIKLAQEHSYWFWSEFSKTAEYLKKMEAHILKYHWIDNKFGRRRRLPEAATSEKYIRAEAVRQGINAQIQGTASDIAQCGFMKIHDYLKINSLKSKVLWSVHDECCGYVHDEEIELLKVKVPELMVQKDDLYLPLSKIKVKLGSEFEVYNTRWGD